MKKYGWIDKQGHLKRDENGNYRVFDSYESAEETRKFLAKTWDDPERHKSDTELHQDPPEDPLDTQKTYQQLKTVELTDDLFK